MARKRQLGEKLTSKYNRNRYIRGKVLRPSVGIQEWYTGAINKLVDQMVKETKQELTKLFKEEFAQEHFENVGMNSYIGYTQGSNFLATMDAAGIGSQARILVNATKKKYDQLFGKLAMGLSPEMADKTNRTSFEQSHSSVKDMPNLKDESGKITIDIKALDPATKQILKATSARSADFIKTVPERYLNGIANSVYESITNGQGLKDLIPELEKQSVSISNWANNTAMDQTRKAFNGLNLGRMRKIGIEKGEWIHSGGSQHPRELHEDYDGRLFNLNEGAPVGDDDGNMVLPGDEPNCRCSFTPVVAIGNDEDDEE